MAGDGCNLLTSLAKIPPILPKEGMLMPYFSNSFCIVLISSSEDGERSRGRRGEKEQRRDMERGGRGEERWEKGKTVMTS